MSFNPKSAGGRVATDSAAQTGVEALPFIGIDVPPSNGGAGACTRQAEALDEVFSDLHRQLRRITVVAESASAQLELLRGVQIDREDMLAVFSLIEQLGRDSQRLVSELKPMAFAAGEVKQ